MSALMLFLNLSNQGQGFSENMSKSDHPPETL